METTINQLAESATQIESIATEVAKRDLVEVLDKVGLSKHEYSLVLAVGTVEVLVARMQSNEAVLHGGQWIVLHKAANLALDVIEIHRRCEHVKFYLQTVVARYDSTHSDGAWAKLDDSYVAMARVAQMIEAIREIMN